MKENKLQRIFRRFGIIAIVSVYLLILAGGIVRSTGSGMGCPDWPRCFGSWIPPTDESQLSTDYKEVYREKRHIKNKKLARYLEAFNMNGLANQVLHEDTDPVNLLFNPTKTYIEYINRVLGVITGFFIFLIFLYSFAYLKEDKSLIALSFGNLILVGFQGWIGSLVVSTDLLHWMVTVHMLLSFVVIAILIYTVFKVSVKEKINNVRSGKGIRLLIAVCIVSTFIQVAFGTQVREEIDQISKSFFHINRHLWVENLGIDFIIHRSFSWFILAINLVLVYMISKKAIYPRLINNLGGLILLVVVFEVVSGVVLSYFSIPAFLQPLHLFLATIIFGIQYLLWLIINLNKSQVKLVS